MTALAALILVAIALGAIFHPLLAPPPVVRGRRVEAHLNELEEAYRSALADLQDAQTDWEIGNISEADYAALRDRYRRCAAEALHDITAHRARRAQLQAEIEREIDGRAATGQSHRASAPGLPHGEKEGMPPHLSEKSSRGTGLLPVGVAAAAVMLAVAGVVVLYLRGVHVQAAQTALALLPVSHAHTVTIDEGAYWVGHHNGLLRSVDGREWRPAGVDGDVMAVVSGFGGQWLALGHDLVVTSADAGATWGAAGHNLPGTDIHGAQRGATGIYAYVVGFGLFRSTDGEVWEPLAAPVSQGVSALAVLPNAGGGETIFLAAGGTVIRSPDAGRTWSSAAGAVNLSLTGAVSSVAADPTRGAVYAATTEGLFRSTSGGANWTKLPLRASVAAAGARGEHVAAVDDHGRFFFSADGGATWAGDR